MNLRQFLLLLLCLAIVSTAVVAFWWKGWGLGEPVRLRLATGPSEGAYASLGQGIADAVHGTAPNVTVDVQTTAGSIENISLLSSGEADLAIVQNDTDPQGDVRTLIPLHRGVCHFLVHKDEENIRDIYDLIGKRVAVGKPNSGNQHIVLEMLQHFGVTPSNFDMRMEGIKECGEKLERKELDAALIITAITSPSLTALIKRGTVKYVSLGEAGDANKVDGFAVTYPYIERFTIPRFVYPIHEPPHGIPATAIESFALRSTLVCRADLSDTVAHTIVESIISNRAQIVRDHHEAHDITEHFDPAELQFPMHHGATAFYQRQRPGFLERYSESMGFLLSLFLAICGMAAAFNKWLMVGKKNRIDRYYSRLSRLLDEVTTESISSDRLHEIETELIDMRRDALQKLVNEDLLVDESFRIFQSLLADCQRQVAIRLGSTNATND